MTADATLWQLDRVSLEPGRLREVTLSIRSGATVVIGWSGAGKTSLLNLLVGFEQPHQGHLGRRVEKIAWVPQDNGLWPHCTVREHLSIAGASPARMEKLLAEFDLAPRSEARPHELSEGEQSRVAVMRALAMEAGVVVMDEPLVHVDPARVGGYWRAIREHLARRNASLLFSTHVPETAMCEASTAVCLHGGAVLYEGPIRDLYARPSTPALMSFLGPGNWISPEESRLWLGREAPDAHCLRPEVLQIHDDAHGACIVASARFMGAIAECELEHLASGMRRTFVHRPSRADLQAGVRVTLSSL